MPDLILAYPHDGHDPDETITVDDDNVAAQMVRDGLARPAVGAPKPDADTKE